MEQTMKTSKNAKKETSNRNIHGNDNSSKAHAGDPLQELSTNSLSGPKYETFNFGINQEFIQENIKNKHNLVRPHKQKFPPFTRSQRRKRRAEVYKIHFEHGVPATRILEMIKVDSNTINNDLKILYRQSLND